MSPIQSMIAVLFALGSAAALAQNGAAPQPPTGKPVDDSATYGPVLNPQQPTPATTRQPTPASTQAAGEARPQAQEERAGQPPVTSKQNEVDPSARPAPGSGQPPASTQPQAPAQPQTQQPKTQLELQGKPERQQQTKKQAQRRPGAVQRIEPTPRIAAPAPAPVPRAPVAAAPSPVGPQSSQVVSCVGGTCTDTNGTTYNAGGPGNVAVSSSGRACTTNGTTVQCL